ncbi:PLP-dependent aminotransferase family protein (plasmid) [Ensifer sp. PDNC004]|uniref:aminotransferase-like domain-containing protein n=1 Tax=Ensifer sp. PDNC004 TaxID=2811423 RepID=UPI001966C959|nr:PLP-dependent aminotransferase family protein [Ensifer sp. PDNC004]QRY66052.1 PLP-dependent aminotransferase family protein [Ensifer sp. PDNC004]
MTVQDLEIGSETLLEGVMATIRQRIAGRILTPGTKLPSIRAFANTMRVSKSTVVEAYERLVAEGVIRSKPGAGFFVSAPLAPLSLAEIGPRLDRAVDPLWVSRQALETGDNVLKPGCGWLPPSWMPETAIRRALKSATKLEASWLTDYGTPLGHRPLRQLLARRLGEHGVEASPDQIILTESGTQAIDLLCRFLIEPGDTVVVDDPCYFNFHALLRAHRADVVSVPYTPSGPDLEKFAEVLATHRPRLYITNSALHNPTGATLSPVVAHRLLKLAEQAGLTIVEDDIFADFEHAPAPRLAAFDGLERVVQIGSFSKTLSASIRCGFIAAPREWIEGLVDLKIATTFGGPSLSAELAFAMLKDGSYRKHMEALRQRLSRAMSDTAARLGEIGITPWIEPQAGMFLWCRLPESVDAAEVAQKALQQEIVLAPGNVFSHAGTANGFLRFNVSQCDDARLFKVLPTIMRQCGKPPAG